MSFRNTLVVSNRTKSASILPPFAKLMPPDPDLTLPASQKVQVRGSAPGATAIRQASERHRSVFIEFPFVSLTNAVYGDGPVPIVHSWQGIGNFVLGLCT